MTTERLEAQALLDQIRAAEFAVGAVDAGHSRLEMLGLLRCVRESISRFGRRPSPAEGTLLGRAEILLTHKGDLRLAAQHLRTVMDGLSEGTAGASLAASQQRPAYSVAISAAE